MITPERGGGVRRTYSLKKKKIKKKIKHPENMWIVSSVKYTNKKTTHLLYLQISVKIFLALLKVKNYVLVEIVSWWNYIQKFHTFYGYPGFLE